MDLLDANDIAGTYPASWYAATAQALPPFAALIVMRGQMFALSVADLPACQQRCIWPKQGATLF